MAIFQQIEESQIHNDYPSPQEVETTVIPHIRRSKSLCFIPHIRRSRSTSKPLWFIPHIKRSKYDDTTMVILHQSMTQAVTITSNKSEIQDHTTCSKEKNEKKRKKRR